MTKQTAMLCAVFSLFGCGAPPVPGEPGDTRIPSDTLRAADSIGVFAGDENLMFGAITSVSPLPGGGAAVLDRATAKISLFDENGSFMRSFGGFGEAPGMFQRPSQFAVLPGGKIVVGELMGGTTLLSGNGEYLASWQYERLGGMPLGIYPFDENSFLGYGFSMLLGDGSFMISISLKRYHAATGEVMGEFFDWRVSPRPDTDFVPAYVSVATDPERGRVYLSRFNTDAWRIEVYDGNGTHIEDLELFPERRNLPAADGSFVPGVIIVSYMYQDESGSSGQHYTNIPDYHPFISDLGVDPQGNIWARRGGASIADWDVVTPEGEWLREVHVELDYSEYSFPKLVMGAGGIYAFALNPQEFFQVFIMR